MSNLVNISGWLGTVIADPARSSVFPTVTAWPRHGRIVVFDDGITTQRYGVQQLA